VAEVKEAKSQLFQASHEKLILRSYANNNNKNNNNNYK
jgi:hypothetical protein